MAGNSSFLVDGIDNTEQFFNENAGRTRIASQISQDAVQEFQVVSSNFTAEYGRASAGVVNTVTRSGTNDMHGTAYWFFRNRTFNARDRYAAFNPPEYRHQAGASIGGPIKKDKLFYFLNTEIQRAQFPDRVEHQPPGRDRQQRSLHRLRRPGRDRNADRRAVQRDRHAFCRASSALIPRRNDQELAFGKLDWRPSERNAFSASFNYLHFVAPNGIQSAIALNTGAGITSNGDDSVRVRNGRLSWTGIPTNSMVNEVRFGWFTDRQADDFDPGVQTAGLGYLSLTVGEPGARRGRQLPAARQSERAALLRSPTTSPGPRASTPSSSASISRTTTSTCST